MLLRLDLLLLAAAAYASPIFDGFFNDPTLTDGAGNPVAPVYFAPASSAESSASNINTGSIIAIVAACIFGIGIAMFVVAVVLARRKMKKQGTPMPSGTWIPPAVRPRLRTSHTEEPPPPPPYHEAVDGGTGDAGRLGGSGDAVQSGASGDVERQAVAERPGASGDVARQADAARPGASGDLVRPDDAARPRASGDLGRPGDAEVANVAEAPAAALRGGEGDAGIELGPVPSYQEAVETAQVRSHGGQE